MYRISAWSLLAAVNLLSAQGFDKCILPNQQAGECRLLPDCPEAVRNLKNAKPSKCGFAGIVPIVCCRKSSTPATELSTSTGGTYDDAIIFNYLDDVGTRRTPQKTTNVPKSSATESVAVSARERKAETMCKQYTSDIDSLFEIQILRGTNANRGDFPHLGALGYLEDAGLKFRCGGSLISDRFVLTAAHCIVVVGGAMPSLVRLGTVDIEKNFDTSLNDFAVEMNFVHVNFDRIRGLNDIALLRLARNVIFTKIMHPACLYTSSDNPESAMTIAGWGWSNNTRNASETSPVLLEAKVSAVPTATCNRQLSSLTFNSRFPGGLLSSQICAQDLNNISNTCLGDSGGPAQVPLEGSASVASVVGITSFGRDCALPVPSVYTRVSSYLDWIEGIVWP